MASAANVMIQSFWTDWGLGKQCRPRSGCSWRSCLISVYTVCHPVCIFWTHYFMVKPPCSNFKGWMLSSECGLFHENNFLWNTIFIILVHSILICNPTENFYQLIFEGKNGLKGKRIQKYNWILSKSIWKTAHFDANFMKIGFLLLKILQFYIFKMAANGGRHFEINTNTENYKSQFISQQMHIQTLLTNVILVYCVINTFIVLFY